MPAVSSRGRGRRTINDINMVPFIDVMLVLLIIFLITIPVVTTSVKVNLPHKQQQPIEPQPDNVILSVNAQGQAFWLDKPMGSQAELIT